MNNEQYPSKLPAQEQNQQPGMEKDMRPLPETENPNYQGSNKLQGKNAIITGGDSGIGRSVAIAFAKEGANVAIIYLNESNDAEETKHLVEEHDGRCLLIAGDIGDEDFCKQAVQQTVDDLGSLDILVNNAGEQHPQDSIMDIGTEQLEKTFRTNVFSMFHLTSSALPHLKKGSAIINTTSITAYKGHPKLLDYSSTKGAITSFTRSLALQLAEKGIRVNGVAPGPIWTPLIPSTFTAEEVSKFGQNSPMKRPGQPEEIAPAFVDLASHSDSSYVSGQILHNNGGQVVNG
ncbi:NAD(P)-dependent dehydrogenase (short-subunit alcohol dehydrogenase family) [Neobacillus niacini]|uniref:SDR family oxidoreductase n=1 Tax=Neobacillus niacini TaxID=86668 RepID=UPI002858AC69|nr:SDR family oxidoreductase [Neobacillus niacini]MDR7076111.1 NAD(P)-dependent dehydrogenase (short-subunit alcohol dehydrogenase family) [Neobacillus niacini]